MNNSTKHNTLTECECLQIQETFQVFDEDRDGKLDEQQFQMATKSLGLQKTIPELRKVMEYYDKEERNKIKYCDFIEIMTQWKLFQDPSEEFRKMFELFDIEKKGKIDLKALRCVAQELGENLDDDFLRAMIREFDEDKDGAINQEEFMTIMSSD